MSYSYFTEQKQDWNFVTEWCRGLIWDLNTLEIVAAPYRKFYNIDQTSDVTLEKLKLKGDPIRVADKLDGSLGILFYDK